MKMWRTFFPFFLLVSKSLWFGLFCFVMKALHYNRFKCVKKVYDNEWRKWLAGNETKSMTPPTHSY